jgi:glycerol-3-phosphate acyltransferase PlsX
VEVRIALDAMGGDQAPRETVRGALDATKSDAGLHVVLVGDGKQIGREIAEAGGDASRCTIAEASEVIGGDEAPVEAIRRKRDSSIVRACEVVQRGEAQGLVAAGSTGAAVAAATLTWKLIPTVRRAGIAVTFPNRRGGHTVICDVGANVSCKPLHLLHYGIMAAEYARLIFGKPEPTIGLLNVGSEEGKGNELVKETLRLFSKSSLNFVGHIEGNEIFEGRTDVVVCEGFVGNVVLKAAEGLYETIAARLVEFLHETEKTADATFTGKLGEWLKRVQARMDYAEYGGAPLLGVNGLCMISHGRSDARAIRNALLLAARFTRNRVLEQIDQRLRAT